MKYIIVIDNQGEESPILFPESINHNSAVNNLRTVVVSAGFCFKEDGQWVVSGRSESLRKEARHEDSELIRRFFK